MHRIRILRNIYLKKIEDYRTQAKNIIYLDKTWYDTHDVCKRDWADGSIKTALDVSSSRGKRIIILHAGGKNGFVKDCLMLSAKNISSSSADYHQDMDGTLFEVCVSNLYKQKNAK